MDTEYYNGISSKKQKRPIKNQIPPTPKGLGSRASIGITVKSLASPINLSKIENSYRVFTTDYYSIFYR